MKNRIGEIVLVSLIVLMLTGMLTGAKSNASKTVNLSEFENNSTYETSGYTSEDPFLNEGNDVSNLNEKISVGISKIINGLLDGFFDIVKKVVT